MFGLKYIKEVATLKLDQNKCIGCKRCLQVCPHAVFGFESKKAVIQNLDACMECGACMKNCPAQALEVKSGVGCAAGIINGFIRGTEPTCDCDGTDGSACC